jgi:hypothetical protein
VQTRALGSSASSTSLCTASEGDSADPRRQSLQLLRGRPASLGRQEGAVGSLMAAAAAYAALRSDVAFRMVTS